MKFSFNSPIAIIGPQWKNRLNDVLIESLIFSCLLVKFSTLLARLFKSPALWQPWTGLNPKEKEEGDWQNRPTTTNDKTKYWLTAATADVQNSPKSECKIKHSTTTTTTFEISWHFSTHTEQAHRFNSNEFLFYAFHSGIIFGREQKTSKVSVASHRCVYAVLVLSFCIWDGSVTMT